MRILKQISQFCLTICFLCTSLDPILRGEETSLPDTVGDTSVSIQDLEGKEQFPFRIEEAKAAVLFFVTQDCPISNAYAPELARLNKEFGSKGFKLMLIYVDPDVTNDEIKNHMKDYSLTGYTAFADKQHILVNPTGATVTPEAVVVLPDSTIAYRGRINNMYPDLGQRRRVITEKDLRNALNSIIENKPIQVPRTRAVGCYMPNI
jgi:thiol-disulfide isomerase/thioredoxin